MSTSSSHWYDAEANSCHEIIGKNGKPRKTTIKDARENKWFPSVTTVLGILSKPQLETWKLKQVIDAALIVPRKDKEEIAAYYDRVIDAAFEQVDDAADLGTNIHKAIEEYLDEEVVTGPMQPYVYGVQKWAKENGVEFLKHELRLVNKSHGYAGTTDAIIQCPKGTGILDFKSRKSIPGKPMEAYEDQVIQIAAYDIANFSTIPGPQRIGVNVFISTTEPGRVEATWYDHLRLMEAWDAFNSALTLWRFIKGYDPR